MNMHEGVVEDGVLATCGICGCQVHMLDPEEQDWICDPCSMDGWSGTKSAWRLRRGDVIHRNGEALAVVYDESFGKRVCITVQGEKGQIFDLMLPAVARVYIHMNRRDADMLPPVWA
jgi:hypothetical protein